MKIEHLSIKGTCPVRDTDDILPETVAHFAPLATNATWTIPKTDGMSVKTTLEQGIAIFDIKQGDEILSVNCCCFDKADREAVMLYVRDIVSGVYGEAMVINQPKTDCFLYSIVMPAAVINPAKLMLCGEIEFYIWDAIRRKL